MRKVRLATTGKVAVLVRGGTADRGEMARVDVFREARSNGAFRFHLVPIYPHQIADPAVTAPPSRAVVAYKDEAEWTDVKEFEFLFSLSNNSLVEVASRAGKPICGYFKGFNRSVAAIALADPICQRTLQQGIGTKTLGSFRKLTVDRLGRLSEVPRETRTWHGVACT